MSIFKQHFSAFNSNVSAVLHYYYSRTRVFMFYFYIQSFFWFTRETKSPSTIQTSFLYFSAALCACIYVLGLITSQEDTLGPCAVPHWPNIMLNSSG